MTRNEYNDTVRLHSDGIYRFILKNVRDSAAAQDIVQDSYEKLWIKRDDVRAESAKSYLFTIAYNGFIDFTRKNKHPEDIEGHSDALMAEQRHDSDLKATLDLALSKLPEIQRSVILLRDYEGYSYEEIGKITQLTESQVKVYIFRGRKTLRDFLVKMDTVV